MIYLVSVVGLFFGSLASVVVAEFENLINDGDFDLKRFLFGRSKCPHCGVELKWYNLVPLFSFIFQKGKCSMCGKKISWIYPMIELLMAVLFGAFFFEYGFQYEFLISVLVSFVSLIILFVDLKTMRIPTMASWLLIGLGILYGVLVNSLSFFEVIIGGVVGFLFFYLQSLVSKGKWVGMGDADLGLAIGVMFGPIVGLYTILQSYVFGTIVLLPLILLNKDKFGMKSQIPFGPFLVFGLIFSMFFGNIIVEWYIQNFIII